jgi:hypothetical protein
MTVIPAARAHRTKTYRHIMPGTFEPLLQASQGFGR